MTMDVSVLSLSRKQPHNVKACKHVHGVYNKYILSRTTVFAFVLMQNASIIAAESSHLTIYADATRLAGTELFIS